MQTGELCSTLGEAALQCDEKQITLFHIDECWTEHLARIAHMREGIYLFSVGGYTPLDEFHKMAAHAFQDLLRRIDDRIITTFQTAEITEKGIDLDKEGLRGPGATWTYLVNDNPFWGMVGASVQRHQGWTQQGNRLTRTRTAKAERTPEGIARASP